MKLNKKNKKRRNQKKHAIKRIKQRFDLEINNQDYESLCLKIKKQADDIVFIKKQSLRVSLYKTNFKEKNIILVYDKIRKSIITVLCDKKKK